MKVFKRNGDQEPMNYNKIKNRIQKLCTDQCYPGALSNIDVDVIVQKTINMIFDGISTTQIDELAASICAKTISLEHQELASRILVSSHHKETDNSFVKTMDIVKDILDPSFYEMIQRNKSKLNKICVFERDYAFSYFAMTTMIKSYLLKDPQTLKVVERPQHMFLRVSLHLWRASVTQSRLLPLGQDIDWDNVINSYNALSNHLFTHATPTLYNAGTVIGNLASCYLLGTDDTVEGLYRTVTQCAILSKSCGGIGLHISNVRGKGQMIKKTVGKSSGIVPWLKVINATAKHIDQGGKRSGSIACYLEPWHCDIESFIELRKNQGADENRARDIFLALWVSDYFMECVKNDKDWHLMSEDACPGLSDTWGPSHTALYTKYIEEGKFIKVIKARDLWRRILIAQSETGMPYISFKDTMNKGCTQSNLGTLKSSNLCHEITLVSDSNNIQVCVLASISLSHHYDPDTKTINYQKLYDSAYQLCLNLNRVIEVNHYPLEEARKTALRDRPIGIGIQGFADLIYKLDIPVNDRSLNYILIERIQAVIYYGALKASIDLAKKAGKPYDTFKDSPWSKGLLQFDLLGYKNPIKSIPLDCLGKEFILDWESIKKDLLVHGLYNSTLTALMPTASTSLLLNNYESFEIPTSHLMKRNTQAGEFLVINSHLLKIIESVFPDKNIRKSIIDQIIENDGSVQYIPQLSDYLKSCYLTSFEINQKLLIEYSSIRQRYIDQSQSLNLFIEGTNLQLLNELLFYAHSNGLKSGLYYLRSKSIAKRDKFILYREGNKTVEACPYNPGQGVCESCQG